MTSPATSLLASAEAFDKVIEAISRPSPNVEWLLKAGPIARRLNEEARRDNQERNAA